MNFNVGDKVKYIGEPIIHMTIGCVYEIIKIYPPEENWVRVLDDYRNGHDIKTSKIELASDNPSEWSSNNLDETAPVVSYWQKIIDALEAAIDVALENCEYDEAIELGKKLDEVKKNV